MVTEKDLSDLMVKLWLETQHSNLLKIILILFEIC